MTRKDTTSAEAGKGGQTQRGGRSEPLFLETDSYRRKRTRDSAHLLPLLGLVLFLLPLLVGPAERAGNETSGGLIYLFVIWVLLTGFAFWLSIHLKHPDKEDNFPGDGADTPGDNYGKTQE